MGHDKIANRLGMILHKLNEGERLSLQELSEEFGVSLRTLQRDFNERLSFLPIEVEEGYYYVPQYCLGKLNFNDVRTILKKSGVIGVYPVSNDDFIIDLLNEKVSKSYIVEGASYEQIDKRSFLLINLAILNTQKLSFNYKQKERVVEPYRLINTHGIWYLIAQEDGILKNFSFTKLQNLISLEESFEADDKLLKQIEEKQTTWITQEKIEVVLRVDNDVMDYFVRRVLLPNQKIVEKRDTYSIISASISYEEEILSFVRYWIPHIAILSPSSLQEKLHATLQNYLHKNF